ncbi:glutamate receptor ionotropic, delta-2 [Fopius arisanus]|uniref:Glutamate receptor ionotropic, delta-2 n=1 Tax=Fopius arisanus TaxID=64838 RepID=A0A9R1T1T0_9HYME|nr:PREDICTED: glutamate receptor ionotropic, delta-2 [Fopius arisanus]
MRGIELMMMSITALGNVTNPEDNGIIFENPYDWENSPDYFKISLSDVSRAAFVDEPLPKSIRVATLETPPYSSTVRINGSLMGEGYAFEILNLIVNKLNVSYEIVQPKRPGLGDESRGLLGLLKNQEIDIAVAFIPMIWNFTKFTRYSPILDETSIVGMMMRPSESASGSGLLAPFDTTVWICILISLLVIGPIVFLFTSFRSYLWNRTKVDKYDFTSCVWFTYGALLKQGSSITPVNTSTRLVFATWWIFITILTSFYTANLTAFLTLSRFTLPYKSVEDIVKKKVPWFFENDRTIDNIFGTEHNNIMKELANSPYKMEVRDGKVLSLLRQNTLFLGERDIIETIIFNDYTEKTRKNLEQSQRCPYVTVPKTLYNIPRGFIHQKNSKIRQAFDKQLQILIEVGIIKYLETKNLPKVKYCPLNLKTTERQLKNSDLSLTYRVIAAGFIAALIMFIYEIIRRRKDVSCLCCKKSCFCCAHRIESSDTSGPIVPGLELLPNRKGRVKDVNAVGKYDSSAANYSNANIDSCVGKISPIYESIYGNGRTAKKTYINGRDYWMITAPTGDKRLIPIRAPSALLFQYTT